MREESGLIVKEIMAKISEITSVLSAKDVTSDRAWTVAILKSIGELGEKEYGYHVCPKLNSEEARVASEWLCDLIWYEDDSSGLKRIRLAMESEWSPTEWKVYEDFQKLLAVRADVKVLVAQDYEQTINHCVSNIKSFEPNDKESIYLFALFGRSECRFAVFNGRGDPL